MRHGLVRRTVAATLATLLALQSTPFGIVAAYATNESVSEEVRSRVNALQEELAAKADEYPDGGFAFYTASAEMSEGDGDLAVQVVRWGGTDAEATLDVKAVDLTASYGDDYTVYYQDGPFERTYLEDETAEGGDASQEGAEGAEGSDEASSDDAAAAEGVESDAADEGEEPSEPAGERVEATPLESTGLDAEGNAVQADEGSEPEDAPDAVDAADSLRGAYSTQTGTETVNTNWRGEYEEYLSSAAAAEGANEISEALPGAGLTLTFEAGEYAKTLYVHVENDDRSESDEAFKLVLGGASAGVLASQMQFDVTIVDDDPDVPVLFAMRDAEVTVDASGETAEVVVERTSGIDYYAGVVLRTVSGTAQSGGAYVALDGVTIPFAPGETERTVSIELVSPDSGTYFDVRIDTDSSNVSGDHGQTRVHLGAAEDAAPEAEGPLATQGGSTEARTFVEMADPAKDATVLSSSRATTVDGVVYDELSLNLSWSSPTSNGNNSSAWVFGTLSYAREATRSYVTGTVTGYTNWAFLGKPAYKNYTISVNGQTVAHADADSKSYGYSHTFNLNWAMSSNPVYKFLANADGTNDHAQISCSNVKFYYPRYTLTLASSDAKQTLKGRRYVSTGTWEEFDVSTLSGSPSWSSRTVSRNGGVSLQPGNVTSGVEIDRYDLYVGGTKVLTTKSSYLSYTDLNNIRASYDGVLRSGKYRITVKPVYKTKSATVTFAAEDASAVSFSGDKSGQTGFKAGDTLKCTQIDEVKFTATCPNNQRLEVGSVTRSKNSKSNAFETLYPQSSSERSSFTRTVTVDRDTEELKVYYRDLTLTYQYHPDEEGASNADAGAVLVYDASDIENPLGASTVGQPLTLSGRTDMLRTTYLADVLPGEGFETVEGPNGITYSTRTIWTYADKAGVFRSTTGNSLLYRPYYANETVYYHFKSVQDDEVPVGVKGTVYIDETPLFSSGDKVSSKPAVGVELNVGGESALSKSDGSYTIPAKFNKGEYVSAFLSYDSLTSVEEVALSKDTVRDFHISVDGSESLTVIDSSMSKLTSTGERDMGNNVIYENKAVESVLLEDARYTFKVVANGSAGVTPSYAEFYFYGKDGQLKTSATKKVNFSGNTVTLELNPVEANLSVGDSMTVKLFDSKGNGYFEHQTSVILGEKMEGMYTFNYKGAWSSEDDNLFVKAIGGLSIGYDFVLDALSNSGGTYADEDGQHQLVYIGFGDGFSNKGTNADEEVYQTMTEAIQSIKDVNAGAYRLDHADDISVFGSESWSFNVSVGAIYDAVMQEEGENKGKFMFSHYLLLADVGANYYREWEVPVGSVKLKFTLGFSFGNQAEGTSGAGVKWHFYNPDDEPYYVSSSDAIDLMASDDIESEGYFNLTAGVEGTVGVSPASFLEIIGALEVELNNNVSYDGSLASSKWADSGSILLTPTVKIKVLKIPIPLWTDTWRFDWTTREGSQDGGASAQARMMDAISENLSSDRLLFTSTEGAEAVDYSYTERRSGWDAGSVARALTSILPTSAESVEEQVLQDGFLSDSDIAVQDLGDGRYLAVFLDVVSGRADENKMAAYYSIFDGSFWSSPQILEEDGTEDQQPTICEAGSKGYLVVWSDASRALSSEEPMVDRLNSFDLTGRFVDAQGSLSEVMNITKTSGQDVAADSAPQVTYFNDDSGTEHLKIYYTKSEYEITNASEGEVVGDLMNPYQVIAVRDYDLENNKWVDAYSDKLEDQIKEQLKGQLGEGATDEQVQAAYESYVQSWYGQQFLNLAPSVSVSEELDEYGYWADGTTATVTELDETASQQSMQKDSAAIGYDGLSLLAYSLDEGGMAQATGDQKLYLQIYNANDDEYHHPIQITSEGAEISDLQFVRTRSAGEGDGGGEITWLYWKETAGDSSVTQIRRIDVTALVSDPNILVKDTTDGGSDYYYIYKAEGSDGQGYVPPTTLVESTPEVEEGDSYVSIGNFKVRVSDDGRYSFVAWTQPVGVETEEGDRRQEYQLFAMREDLVTGERSLPVQLTDASGQYITQFDMAITEDGNLDVLAAREFLAEQPVLDESGNDTGSTTWQPDASTSELAFMRITPRDTFTMGDVEQGDAQVSEDGAVEVPLSGTVLNDSFRSREDVVIEALDTTGKTVWSSTDPVTTYDSTTSATDDGGVTFEESEVTLTPEPQDVSGGERLEYACQIPVDGNGFYDVTIRVRSGSDVLAERRVSGTLSETLSSTGLSSEIPARDEVRLSTTVTNSGPLATKSRTCGYGYVDDDGTRHELGKVEIPALEAGASHDVSVDVATEFADFASTRGEDGSITASRRFYLDLDPSGAAARAGEPSDGAAQVLPDNTATLLYRDVELTATPEQVAVMDSLGELSAVYSAFDEESRLVRVESLEAGSSALLSLTSDGEIAQNVEDLVNGLKVVWDPIDTDVATVTEDGSVIVKRAGSVRVTGRVMPADMASTVYSDGSTGSVDGSATLPDELIRSVSVELVVGAGDQGGSDADQGGGSDAGQSGGSGQSSAGGPAAEGMPDTGDPTNQVVLIVATVGGATLVAAGAFINHRRKKGERDDR